MFNLKPLQRGNNESKEFKHTAYTLVVDSCFLIFAPNFVSILLESWYTTCCVQYVCVCMFAITDLQVLPRCRKFSRHSRRYSGAKWRCRERYAGLRRTPYHVISGGDQLAILPGVVKLWFMACMHAVQCVLCSCELNFRPTEWHV